MEQRITRAKARIAAADLPFETPGAGARAERLAAVAVMIYLVFTEGYTDPHPDSERAHLCDEAIRLGQLILAMFPEEPELLGLLALMRLQHARRAARFDAAGETVLLEDQDRSLWDRAKIDGARALLDRAARLDRPGPYQIQAAIAAVHARAARPEDTEWDVIDNLYAALERLNPSPVITLNRAVAVWKNAGPAPALAMVEPLAGALDGYFYFHGVRGVLLGELDRPSEARAAFDRAVALANTRAEAAQIRLRLDRLAQP
jgi:RNA polymerase sigma-70 factor (ECF subfamily)